MKRTWLVAVLVLFAAVAADPKTAMPNLRVTEPDARDIASYLYTLR